jgi:hypothetical protein
MILHTISVGREKRAAERKFVGQRLPEDLKSMSL